MPKGGTSITIDKYKYSNNIHITYTLQTHMGTDWGGRLGMHQKIKLIRTSRRLRASQKLLQKVNKRPVGLIAPPFIISFLATGN